MAQVQRRTIVVHDRLAMRELRLDAAHHRRHGLQIITFEQLAARLAGGLLRPVDDESLRAAIQAVLPATNLGELDGIKDLPGMVSAAVDTLRKAWLADIDLHARAAEHSRLRSIASLEGAVREALPATMLHPADLVEAALERLEHAEALLGPTDIIGFTELPPCWRPVLHAIATRVPVRWIAGPRRVPPWLDSGSIEIVREAPQEPEVVVASASTAYHEAVEALRWARQLICSGTAEPADIAIASVSPNDYDDHFLALRGDANLDLGFAHGIKVTASREGQAAAALADIVLRGLSQSRVRRLNALLSTLPGPFQALPAGWIRLLPADAPLASREAWTRLIERLSAADWPDGNDHGPALARIVTTLADGVDAAEEAGEALLHGRALAIWRRALRNGAAASLDLTLEALKFDDGPDPCVSAAWMPASALAASPRRYVRLLGLNSSRWPRGISEDRLLSDHIIPTAELDPLPVGDADRRDFATILATTQCQVVLSHARRDSDGRLLGRSVLLREHPSATYLPRNAVPGHAFSETDRLTARPGEFRTTAQARAAHGCWRNWWREELTPHDGLVRPDHPVLRAIVERTQSASSLRQLLRNPLGFTWRYGLRWRAPESGEDPLVLDALKFGDLVHMTLERALRALDGRGGLSAAAEAEIAAAIDAAGTDVAQWWESERSVPPPVIWRRTLDMARELSRRGLEHRDAQPRDARAYGEVPFGGAEPRSDAVPPWDTDAEVRIPETDFRIAGYIDRLDISADGRSAFMRDYKTGRPPKKDIILDGGKELQRCLYAFAVRAMLGDEVAIDASLLYVQDGTDLHLDDPEGTVRELAGHLRAARVNLLSGGAVPGCDAGDTYDDLAFALPANAGATYCKRKGVAAAARLGDAAHIWDVP